MEDIIKYAIIADIHANKYALESFLNFIEEEIPVDKILNMGDFVHIGPHPKEVLEVILKDKRFLNVLGNNDLIVLCQRKEEWPAGIERHRAWTLDQIGSPLLDELRKVPDSMTFKTKGKMILMLHSHLYSLPNRSIRDNILLYQGKSLKEFVDDYPDAADIILLGHTHEKMYLVTKNKIFINPGSLSLTNKSSISFCLMEFDSDDINVTFKSIPYDSSQLKNDYENRNVAEREFLLKYFYPFI